MIIFSFVCFISSSALFSELNSELYLLLIQYAIFSFCYEIICPHLLSTVEEVTVFASACARFDQQFS